MGYLPAYRKQLRHAEASAIRQKESAKPQEAHTTGKAHGRVWDIITTKSKDYFIDKDLNLHTKHGLKGCVNRVKHFFGAFPLSALTKHVQDCFVKAGSSYKANELLKNKNIQHIADKAVNTRCCSKSARIFSRIYQAGQDIGPIERASVAFGLTRSETQRIERHVEGLTQEANANGISPEDYLIEVAQHVEKARSSDKGLAKVLNANPNFRTSARRILEGAREDVVIRDQAPTCEYAIRQFVPVPYQSEFRESSHKIILEARATGTELRSFVEELVGVMHRTNSYRNTSVIDNYLERSGYAQRPSKFRGLRNLLFSCYKKHTDMVNEEKKRAAARRQATPTRTYRPSSYSGSYSSTSSGRSGKYSPESFAMGYAW